MQYLNARRSCPCCGGEMVPACDLDTDRPQSDGEVADCGVACLACGYRAPAVLVISSRGVRSSLAARDPG